MNSNSFQYFIALINKTVAKKSDDRLGPVSASLDVTRVCNLNCTHCYNSRIGNNSPHTQINTSKIMSIVDEMSDLQLLHLTVTGGEPFIRADLLDVLDYIKARTNMVLTVHTNGTPINREKARFLGSILSRQDIVQVSVEGVEKVHDSIRGKGSWKKASNAIALLSECGVRVRVNLTPTRMNVDKICQYIDTLEGVDEFGATPMALFNQDDLKYIPDPRTTYDIEKRVKQILGRKGIVYSGGISGAFCQYVGVADKNDVVNQNELPPNTKSVNMQCNAGISKFHISSEGSVFPCVFWQSDEFLIGSLMENTLSDIWKRWDTKKTLRELNNVVCGGCVFKNLCKGGCRGMAQLFFGTMNRQDPRCNMRVS